MGARLLLAREVDYSSDRSAGMDFLPILQRALVTIKKCVIVLSEDQTAAIRSVTSGRDTIVCLPTGHGKSIIFELLPWCCSCSCAIVLIVSPLLSLMSKQVADLTQRQLCAVQLSAGMSLEAQSSVEKGETKYLFASPEMLQERRWRDLFLKDHYQKNCELFLLMKHTVWKSGEVENIRS